MKVNTITLLVATVAVILSSASACRCVKTSIEKAYFDENAKFFVQAVPYAVTTTPTDRIYKLRILKQYKSCTKISSVSVRTSISPSTCGVLLKIGTPYVMPLDKAPAGNINSCQFIREFSSLSEAEKTFLKYRQICCGKGQSQICTCASGKPPVNCLVAPCSVSKPPCPEAYKCVDNYCGPCLAEWFTKSGMPACLITTH